MKPKTLILMLVAVACGLVAAFVATQMQPRADTAPTVPVVVAAMDLPAGTVIKDPAKMLMLKPHLPDTVPPGSVARVEDMQGKVLAMTIDKGAPVTTKHLSMQEHLFKPAPEGYRAITVRVNLESATAGFTLPGSHVDLLCTLQDRGGRRVTNTFMENVLVLAVNTHQEQPKEARVIANPSSVTLAIKPQDVARLVWAKELGQLSMSLRRPGEEEIVKPKPVVGLSADATGEEGGTSDKTQVEKVWVARQNILPGKEVVRHEDLFKLESIPAHLSHNAYKESDIVPKGKLAHFVPAGMPVTKDHFVMLPADTIVPKGGKRDFKVTHLLIRVADQDPTVYKFEDGRSTDGKAGAPSKEFAPPPAPAEQPRPVGNSETTEGPTEGN